MSSVTLFSPLTIGSVELSNRVVMAPMTRNRAGPPGNVPTPLMATYYAQRAGAGLIITEATQVSNTGQGYPNTPGLHSGEQVAGWRRVTDAVHAAGGRIFAQLWHVGRISHPFFQPENRLPVSASDVAPAGAVFVPGQGMVPYVTPRPLETDEVPEIVADFAQAAANARAAGFDGVEIHAANGYLVDQFLRDGTNRRTDRYGGTLVNRARFLMEVTGAAADVVGAAHVGVRLSPSGTFNDMRDSNPRATFGHAAQALGRLGIAYLHVTEATAKDVKYGGPGAEPIPTAFFRPLFPGVLITNGGFTAERAQQVLADGHADAVAFGVPFLANPDLPERFRRGAPLNAADVSTFYGGTEKGYTDYPPLSA
jgi:N-ethylmaleimide reductase